MGASTRRKPLTAPRALPMNPYSTSHFIRAAWWSSQPPPCHPPKTGDPAAFDVVSHAFPPAPNSPHGFSPLDSTGAVTANPS